MKKLFSIVTVVIAFLLTGCSSIKVEDNLSDSSNVVYETYSLKNVSSKEEIDPKVAEIFEKALDGYLNRYGYRKGNDLIINYDIKAFDPGNRALRMFIGFGLGKGTLEVNSTLVARDGKKLGSVHSESALRMGFFGGSLNSIIENTAKKVAVKIHRAKILKRQSRK